MNLKQLTFSNLPFIILLGLALYFLYAYSLAYRTLLDDNRKLSTAIEKLQTAEPGDAVPELISVDINGRSATLNFNSDRKHLIFIYSINCKFCQEEFAVWNDLISEYRSESGNIHGLSLDSQIETSNSIDSNLTYLRAASIIAPDKNLIRTYRALATPTVLIVGQGGLVEWVHIGKLKAEEIQQIKSIFG